MQVKVLVAQSCVTLCHPMDYSPPGSSAHGILQVRILEYNIVFQYFYVLQNDHHNKSSNHLSPYKMITISLTICPMLYIISL